MKKIFLIPLLACFSCVMAWAEGEVVVNDFATLKTQLSASGTADVVKLGQDITYGSEVLNIERSLTLDGQGHQIIGSIACELSITYPSYTFIRNTIIAVNRGNVGSNLDVKVKNLYLQHSTTNRREICFAIFDGVTKFALDNVETDGRATNNTVYDMQALLITGSDATPVQLNIVNSKLETSSGSYPAYILKPVTGAITNTTIAGYCGLYFKYQWSSGTSGYGNTVGSRGTNLYIDACTFNCANTLTGESNNFAIFPLEDDGITLNLNNCSFNASTLGDTYQRFLNLQYLLRTTGFQTVNVKLTGDNTHLYNVTADKVVFNGFTVGQTEPDITQGTRDRVDVAINFTVEAGTFTFDPRDVHWYTYSDNKTAVYVSKNSTSNVSYADQSEGSGAITIDLTKYQINEVKQGTKPLYRVVKKAAGEKEPGVKYDLNDDVPSDPVEGAGDNPNTSFELSTGTTMELNQATTNAGYVEVKDNGSSVATTVKVGKVDNPGTPSEAKVDQTLVINNGLDVLGNSKVEVQAGSTLEIGKGGIVTEKPENIVIGADENGAASLIMDPTITVNQTPNLTVKMKAKSIGWMTVASAKEYYWHRFALPIQQASTWVKNPNKSTYVFGWNYSNDNWEQLSALTQMVPFKGYTLSADYENLGDVEYTFTGQLAGNTNNLLEFERNGFNFFGNSYTGYIDILALVEQIMGDNKIDGSVWVWGDDQNYHVVPLLTLRDGGYVYATEIAPMQTFILKQNGSENASAELNYASAVWGNPRYGHSVTPAPSRNIADETTRMRIIVTAENGKSDFVMFTEDAKFSDSFEKGYDGEKYMNENALNMFATVNGANYTAIATDNLEGKMITINTVEAVNYTMSFAKVNGEEYAIRDNATGKVIAIQEGATYEFAAQPNSTVEGRFQIVTRDKVTTAIENTEVKANVKGIYTLMGQYVGEDFNTLPAGVYVVDGVKIVK